MPRNVPSRSVNNLLSNIDRSFFGGLTEKAVLNHLLKDPQPASKFPFVEARNELRRIRSHQNSQRMQRMRIQTSLKSQMNLPEPSAGARELMTRQAVTSKDIASFVTGPLSPLPENELRELYNQQILQLISASSPNNLRTVMQFLKKYWQSGILGIKPTIYDARTQARMLLHRAIDIHPRTRYEGGGEQVGIPDFPKFQEFVKSFFQYLNVANNEEDELHSLLLTLCAKSGPLQMTTDLVMSRSKLDEPTLSVYLEALSSSNPSLDQLQTLRPLLISELTGPSAINFLLAYTKSIDDIMFLVEHADKSLLKMEIYEQCQSAFIRAVLAVQHKLSNLAIMFGLLSRFQAVTRLRSETLDIALEAAIKAQNKAAVQRLLSLGTHSSKVVTAANKYVHTK